jgi:hypothetical protein
VPGKALGHLAAAGVAGAEEQNAYGKWWNVHGQEGTETVLRLCDGAALQMEGSCAS